MALSIQETANVLRQAGFKESEIPTMVAIGMGESGLRPDAHNPRYPDDSYGLFQINMLDEPGYELGKERRTRYGLQSNEQLKDPLTNARAALDIRNRQGLGAWSVYSEGLYKKHLPKVQQVLGSGGDVQSTTKPQPMLTPPPSVEKDKEEDKRSLNIGFLKNFINNLRGREQSFVAPKSGLDVQGMLASAFKAPEFMD